MRTSEDNEQTQTFVAGKPMHDAGGNKRRLALVQPDPLPVDGQLVTTLKHEVQLVVFVRLLPVRLRRYQHVHANLKPARVRPVEALDITAVRRRLAASGG